MNGVEHINSLFNSLPPAYRAEALDFIEFLSMKAKNGDLTDTTDAEWSQFSIENALDGMDNSAENVEYTEADLKTKWR